MKNKCNLVFIFFIICSCNTTQNAFYRTNQNKIFSSREQIANYFHQTNNLDINKMYFFADEGDKFDFLLNDTDADILPYFGLFVNDSTKIIDDFVEEKDCIGIIDKFVRGNYNSTQTEIMDLKKYKLSNFENRPLNINTKNKTLVFVINSNMGKIINYTATYITDNIKKSNDSINHIYLISDPIISK